LGSLSCSPVTTQIFKLKKSGSNNYFYAIDSTVTPDSLGIIVPDGANYLIGSRRSDISEYEVRGIKYSASNSLPYATPSHAFTNFGTIHGSISRLNKAIKDFVS
jgi:hypothetical protein